MRITSIDWWGSKLEVWCLAMWLMSRSKCWWNLQWTRLLSSELKFSFNNNLHFIACRREFIREKLRSGRRRVAEDETSCRHQMVIVVKPEWISKWIKEWILPTTASACPWNLHWNYMHQCVCIPFEMYDEYKMKASPTNKVTMMQVSLGTNCVNGYKSNLPSRFSLSSIAWKSKIPYLRYLATGLRNERWNGFWMQWMDGWMDRWNGFEKKRRPLLKSMFPWRREEKFLFTMKGVIKVHQVLKNNAFLIGK